MTLPPLLSLSFWFNPNPPPFLSIYNIVIVAFIIAALVSGIVAYALPRLKAMDKLDRQIAQRIGFIWVAFGIIGLMLYAFAYERVAYLSMRAFWLPLLIWVIWKKWQIYQFVFKKVPEIRKARQEKEKFEKWLPKKKN